jgi:hypothetical protein
MTGQKLAASAATAILACLILFQILLAAGYPLGSAAWGGSANSDGTVSGISA